MPNDKHITPKVGIATIIRKGNLILLGERIHESGNTWFFPSGHLEIGEKILDCAQREVLEETGLEIRNLKISPYITEDPPEEYGSHFITIYVTADYCQGEAKIKELNKCARWGWFNWDDLPKPQVNALRHFLENKYDPFI